MNPTRSRMVGFRQTMSRLVAFGLIFIPLIPFSASLAANTASTESAASTSSVSNASKAPGGPETTAGIRETASVDLSGFEGHWQRIEVPESDAARESAIAGAVSGLSWIVRKFARGNLNKSTAPPPELQFAWDGERLHQGLADENGEFSRRIELDGPLRVLKDSRGVDFASAWVWTGQELRLRWEQHQAYGSNIYRLDEDADILVIEHTINVTAISNIDPIVFHSRFSRSDLPARAAAGLDPIARVASE
jgi:hypothetical protein